MEIGDKYGTSSVETMLQQRIKDRRQRANLSTAYWPFKYLIAVRTVDDADTQSLGVILCRFKSSYECCAPISSCSWESGEHMLGAVARLQCDAMVNGTGLGAAAIHGNDQLKGARGVQLQFDRETFTR